MTTVRRESTIILQHSGSYIYNIIRNIQKFSCDLLDYEYRSERVYLHFQVGDLLPIFSTKSLVFATISTDLSVNGTWSGGVCEPVCIVPASFSIRLLDFFSFFFSPSIISSAESRSGGARKGPPTVFMDIKMFLDIGANANLFTNCDFLSNIITNLKKL